MIVKTEKTFTISLRIRIRANAALRAKDKTRGVHAPLN